MHRDARRTAASHAPHGNGRIDARRKQAHHFASRTDRQAAHAAHGLRVHICHALHDLDMHFDVGALHLHLFIGEKPA